MAYAHAAISLSDNSTYNEANIRKDADLWHKVIDTEMLVLASNAVYVEEEVPEGVKPIPAKLILNVKRNETGGDIQNYKATLFAKGCSQQPGVYYGEFFVPTADGATLRVLLSLASAFKLEVRQTDVRTAFLNGQLDEEVYLTLLNEL